MITRNTENLEGRLTLGKFVNVVIPSNYTELIDVEEVNQVYREVKANYYKRLDLKNYLTEW